MPKIAPNLNELLSSELAARIVSLSGGLQKLVQIPACNIRKIGSDGSSLTSSVIYQHSFIQQSPEQIQHKIARYLSSKCALAARMDLYTKQEESTLGRKLKEEVRERIQKLQEQPDKSQKKPLDKPQTKQKNNRGGKKVRAYKKRMSFTKIRKKMNIVNFGVGNEEESNI